MSQDISILVTEAMSDDGLSILTSYPRFKIDVMLGLSKSELKSKISDYKVLLVRSQTQVDQDLIQSAKSLELIGRAGVGIDNIDIVAAKKNNIAVINTPTGNSLSTAEMAFGLMLSLARKIPFAHQSLKAGKWDRESFKGNELCQKTLGLIGFGNVSRCLAPRAKAFGMHVIGFDPIVDKTIFLEYGAQKVELDSLLKNSDFISLHCSLTEQTKNIINEETLAKIKRGACIINAARGELIDTNALIKSLNSKHISSAAIDVFKQEPPLPNEPLVNHPQIIATPHLGASTVEAQNKVSALLAQDVVSFFYDPKSIKRIV